MTTKNISKILLACLIPGFMAACSDDIDYTPAETPDNHQVYFSNLENRSVVLEENQTSFPVRVLRVDTSDDFSVNITATQSDNTGIFTVPATATFAKGENSTEMNVAIDFSKVVSGTTYTIDFTIPESETTLYGLSTCTFTIEYFEKGDPLRDLIVGFYEGEALGAEDWSTAWYDTAFDYYYNQNGVAPVRLYPGETPTEVYVKGLFPETDHLNVSDVKGEVYTSNEYEGYLGYVLIEPQELGTYFVNDYWGTYTVYIGAGWNNNAWCSAPDTPIQVWIKGEGSLDNGTATIESLDFSTNGWVLLFGYSSYGAWYRAAYGYSVVTPVE